MSEKETLRDSYRDITVHKMMLNDVVRCDAYERALLQTIQKGHTVLDFGCGTGILSIFAARAGAKRVHAVDRSLFIHRAKAIAAANDIHQIQFHLADHKALTLPEKVDVIVSEWMGHFIFHESMLEPLLYLRDRFLKPGGILIPGRIHFHAAFVTDETVYEDRCFFRRNPYGIDFSPIADDLFHLSTPMPLTASQLGADRIQLVPDTPPLIVEEGCEEKLETSPPSAPFQGGTGALDLYTAQGTPDTLSGRIIPKKRAVTYGICGWFSADLTDTIGLGTGPDDPDTHWTPVFFPFASPFTLKPGREVIVQFHPPLDDSPDRAWEWTVSDGETLIQMADPDPMDS